MKYVRIAEDLFCDLFLYHVIGSEEPGQRIKSELEKKMDAMLRHDYYTKYKTAPDEAAREEATGYSFPSGHTQNAVSVLGCPARSFKNTALRVACIALIVLLILIAVFFIFRKKK